jgi:virulence-associated protein VagC
MTMTTARVFKTGKSQAVRLPKQFRVNASEVESSAAATKSY